MTRSLRFGTWVIPLCYALVAIAAGMVVPRLEAPIFHGQFRVTSDGLSENSSAVRRGTLGESAAEPKMI